MIAVRLINLEATVKGILALEQHVQLSLWLSADPTTVVAVEQSFSSETERCRTETAVRISSDRLTRTCRILALAEREYLGRRSIFVDGGVTTTLYCSRSNVQLFYRFLSRSQPNPILLHITA